MDGQSLLRIESLLKYKYNEFIFGISKLTVSEKGKKKGNMDYKVPLKWLSAKLLNNHLISFVPFQNKQKPQ